MSEGDIPDLSDHTWIDIFHVGPGIALLKYSNGTYRIRHICYRERDSRSLLVAPRLQTDKENGHVIVSESPITVTPSIMCDDCGMHGYITNGKWVPCQ